MMRVLVLMVVGLLFGCGPRDNSDPPDGRSGLIIYRDNLTGCEYLQTAGDRALTPRMQADGHQVCHGEKP